MHLLAFSSCGGANAVVRNENVDRGVSVCRADRATPHVPDRFATTRGVTTGASRRAIHDHYDVTVLVAHLLLYEIARPEPGRHETTSDGQQTLRSSAIECWDVSARAGSCRG